MVDELEELNPRSMEEPHLIYVSIMLTPNEEEEYFKIIS